MNLSEFKAWLEGYSASFKDGAPSPEQWAEVTRRLHAVKAVTVPAPVDANTRRSWMQNLPYWQMQPVSNSLAS